MDDAADDPIVGIQEELQALKCIVGDYNDKLLKQNDEIANLVAKNALLEEQNRAADQRISELEKNGNEDLLKHTTKDEDDWEFVSTIANSYIFLYTSPIGSLPFITGIVVCTMEVFVLSLFFANLLDTATLPADVSTVVRVAQIMAIIITFLVGSDVLRAIRAVVYREGLDEMAEAFSCFTPWKFYFANALMGMQGLLGNIVVFFQIFIANEVLELLLNFTAILFVSELGAIFFYLASIGYAGRDAEKIAKKVESKEVKQKTPKGILGYLHLILFGLSLIAVFSAFGSIAGRQDSQENLAKFVKVEFGDEVDPILGLFSGCYEKQLNGAWDARVRYVQTQPERGQGTFEFCEDDDLETWVFATDPSETVCGEQDFALRSAEERSISFDLLDAKGDQWLLRTGNPISFFQLGEINPSRFEAECGKISIQGRTTGEELCPILTLDAGTGGFSEDYDWSKTFVILEASENETVQFYQHPVFIGESTGMEGYELLFFAGRRWVLASAKKIMMTTNGDPFNKSDVVALFEGSGSWLLQLDAEPLAFLSEAVTEGNEHGTPLGLRWYHSRYANEYKFPFADTSRPVDAIFRCGKCSSRNPCLYEGICEYDGTCTCRHGTTGRLCEIEPLNDGVCNPFFNTESDGYDGGDCCVATCSNVNCGVGDMKFAFGQSLQRVGIGFPNCTDPSMVPITIVIHSEVDDLSKGSFESYSVEVLCEEGAKAALRIALDPSVVGTLNETLYMEDAGKSCLLSFIGMQKWSGLNISYDIFDGLDPSSDSMLLMSEEKNIVEDGVFILNATYSRCLKNILAGAIDSKHLYTGSYQDEAFAWLSNDVVSKSGDCSSNEEYLIERYALLALSFAEEAPESWISSKDHCLWPRVKCDGSKVVDITYDGNTNGALKGLWAPEFTLLRHLERIDVFRNEFTGGSIPNDIYALSALTSLALSNNGLTGSLPTEIGNISALNRLSVYGNDLSGSIPSEVGNLSALRRLALSSNQFSGGIPSEVGRLSALTAITLFSNDLSGLVPSEVGNMRTLLSLQLSRNALSGRIPSEVGEMSALTSITLHKNAMSGGIPSEVGNLGALTKLSLYSNSFSGTIPSEVGNMSGLKRLLLYNNTLSGSLPSEVGKLGSLVELSLYNNTLTGSIPSEIGGMTGLDELHLSNNTFSGSIPSEVGLLSGLKYLNLRDNLLNETLPSEIGLLTNLEALILGGNMLSGLPTEILLMANLKELDLSGNLFSEEQVNEIVVALGLMCSETSVEVVVLTTDDLANSTTWEITMDDGTVVASSSSDDPDIDKDKEGKTCIPVDACNFTVFDHSKDGGVPTFEITRLGKVYEINGTAFGANMGMMDVDICVPE